MILAKLSLCRQERDLSVAYRKIADSLSIENLKVDTGVRIPKLTCSRWRELLLEVDREHYFLACNTIESLLIPCLTGKTIW